jgi:transcriptional regulator with XRE-family HTH domain
MISAKKTNLSNTRRMLENQDTREAVASRLKKVREILGMEKKEFAERAGLTMQNYGPFENARRDLSLQSAKQLRATYGLTLEFLYFGKIDDLPTRISKFL